ncbi:hypothetical protein FACS1894180_4510 [Bacteroidia bacterium]|nr:hypothetical protein FACS1894180_4510 [Bacteroidia bacterium]
MTREDLERYKAMGVHVTPAWERLVEMDERIEAAKAKAEQEAQQEKPLSIKFLSCTADDKNYNLTFEVTATNLKDNKATIFAGKALVFSMPVTDIINPNGTKEITVRFPKNTAYSGAVSFAPLKFIATVICDGLSAVSEEFELKEDTKKPAKATCFCNRDFTVEEMTHIITQLRKSDNVHKETQFDNRGNTLYVDKDGNVISSTDRGRRPPNAVDKYGVEKSAFDKENTNIFDHQIDESMQTKDANIEIFTKEINAMFKEYEINICIRKIHFLAQAYHETLRFHRAYETSPSSSINGGKFYRGRGLLHLTHDYNYYNSVAYMSDKTVKEIPFANVTKILADSEEKNKLDEFVKKTATEMHYAVYMSGAYWGLHKINKYADNDDVTQVSSVVNAGLINKIANGLDERKQFYNRLKTILSYENCIKNKK